MLEQRDLEAIAGILDTKLRESEERMTGKMDEKILASENRMIAKMDVLEKRMTAKMGEKTTESETLLLEELDRLQNNVEKKMDKMQQNLDEINTYYRTEKTEKENLQMLLQITEELQKDVEELKRRTA